ncbi:MAG: sulfatase-like hydrolase/transferase [Betaproteobacteria bacterium]
MAGLLAASGCSRATPPPAARAHDLILITIDTLRADRVGATGGPPGLTPALDALARGGAAFLDATAHVPLTLPSHASILTGRYPTGTGVHDNAGFTLPDSVPTLATVLHASGYHTAAFVASYVLRGSTGLARGFDRYDDRFAGLGAAHLTLSSLERRAPEVAREAGAWLKSAPRPFFLWVHFYDPHAPYDAPPAFAAKYPGRPYDAEVATSDFGVGALLGALPPDRRAGTIVIAAGDHGEALGEHGEAEHGILLYDATLHVPLIMAGPGVPAGRTVKRQVRLVDLLPTALALLGVKPPAGIDGQSLVPVLSGGAAGESPLSYAESRFGELHFGWSAIRSVRDGVWKYIDGPAPELYELSADAGERHNRLADRRDTAQALARELRRIAPATAAPAHQPAADAEERLRSLGYVGGRLALGSDAGADPKQEIERYAAYVKAFNDGLALLENGRPADAESRFRTLAHDYPGSFEAHQYLARALAARGAQGDAIRELDAAIALAPGEAGLYFDEARSLAALSRFDEAFEKAAAGLRLEPSSFDGWLTRGLVARAAGQRAAAQQAFEEALKLNPSLAVAHFELGQLAEARGDREGARREYRMALERDTMLEEARRALDRLSR